MVNLRTEALHRVEDGIMFGKSPSAGPTSFTKGQDDLGQVTSPLQASVYSFILMAAGGLDSL